MLFGRKKVYTIHSDLSIPKDRWKDLHAKLKRRFPSNEELQKSYTAMGALRAMGWDPRSTKGGINKLVYNADNWDIRSMSALHVIAPFVDDGGYIYMISEVVNSYWAIKFQNGKHSRESLERIYIDFTHQKHVEDLFAETVQALFHLGVSKTDMKTVIDKIFVGHVLGR
jgi:Holliday junction resolvasome RuvABC DNA-binding subunit